MEISTTSKAAMLNAMKAAFGTVNGTTPAQLLIYGTLPNGGGRSVIVSFDIEEITSAASPSPMYIGFNSTAGDTQLTSNVTWGGGASGQIATVTDFELKSAGGAAVVINGTVGTAGDDLNFTTSNFEYGKQVIINNLRYNISTAAF